jgi:trans-2,3-dihydro-3-hydroxyanthranilate isomerase
VFTDRVFGGNPLAVFPEAQGLSSAQMQQIAGEFNLSETVFVLPPQTPTGTTRLRIFTPRQELAFAGHPTIGSAVVLASIGAIAMTEVETHIVCEEGVGPVPVVIRAVQGQRLYATLSAARMPEFGPPLPSAADLARLLGLSADDVRDDEEITSQSASVGLPFTLIALRTTEAVSPAGLSSAVFDELLGDYWARDVYVFGPADPSGGADFRVRLFAPQMGIAEDPATGSAAAAFGGYLATRSAMTDGTLKWTLEQGIEIGRPSRLDVEADKSGGAAKAIRVGGHAVLVIEGEFDVPQPIVM